MDTIGVSSVGFGVTLVVIICGEDWVTLALTSVPKKK